MGEIRQILHRSRFLSCQGVSSALRRGEGGGKCGGGDLLALSTCNGMEAVRQNCPAEGKASCKTLGGKHWRKVEPSKVCTVGVIYFQH